MTTSALLKIYIISVAIVSVTGLLYVYLKPPQSMRVNRDGVEHFTPQVLHIETGEPIELGELVRHYRGD